MGAPEGEVKPQVLSAAGPRRFSGFCASVPAMPHPPEEPGSLMTHATPPGPEPGAGSPRPPSEPLPTILARLAEPGQMAGLDDLLRASTHHCRQMLAGEYARIWLARRGGRRLVAREGGEGAAPRAVRRMARGEGLAGWVIARGKPLRLAAGELPEGARGRIEPFRSALLVPLYRRGKAFAAIECVD